MAYVDGFVLPVPKRKLDAYRRMAQKAGKIWKEHGVFFSWIVYEPRKHRDQVNRKVMADPRIKEDMGSPADMPFDAKRMIYGGFKVMVSL